LGGSELREKRGRERLREEDDIEKKEKKNKKSNEEDPFRNPNIRLKVQ
jgi:hypothetical protein